MTPVGLTSEGWITFSRLLQPAIARQSEHTTMQVMEKCATSKFQMWMLIDESDEPVGAVATKIINFPSGLKACVIALGSTVDTDLKWAAMRGVTDELERFAADEGCDVIRIHGRRGWGRVLDGYQPSYVTFEKKVRGVH